AVECAQRNSRRTANRERFRFLGRESLAVVTAAATRDDFRANFYALCPSTFAFNLALRSFELTLRLSQSHIDLSLRFALCFTRGARRVNARSGRVCSLCRRDCVAHIILNCSFSFANGCVALERDCRAHRQAVFSVRDLDATVDVVEFDSWTTGSDLA